jgi:hypothetical protein
MKPHEIQEKLGLTRIRDRNWYVFLGFHRYPAYIDYLRFKTATRTDMHSNPIIGISYLLLAVPYFSRRVTALKVPVPVENIAFQNNLYGTVYRIA